MRSDPLHVEADDQIEFRQLQKRRRPDLTEAQFLDLFAEWRDHYRARREAKAAETSAAGRTFGGSATLF